VLAPLLDALFPKRCAGCGSGPWPFCTGCRSELVVLGEPRCGRCGAPATRPVTGCADCPPSSIAIARAPFGFDGPVRRAVHRLKFGGWRAVAEALAEAMVRAWSGSDWPADVVTWVPLSRERLAVRGYDQARALARASAPGIGAPARTLLRRVGDPGPQARRGGAARREAMRGVFAPAGAVSGRVLLVDDVLTTGATAGACADALLLGGATSVGLLTAARAVSSARRPGPPILGIGLASGSVVAPGNGSPAVDASRGRSDPRKPTLGR
jgi:predicted amidophosphoribosyltransferase